ncbi:hypothetical protein FHT39_003773 [Mitsuaria sp. BK045]|uniref:hypothetical protein n=1 Tax=unclassified Roseateles TaxID=2626991 RepID=UPI00161A2C45|nr:MULTISPECIES: hypothetical protein [unclassified Roseateles]MBB3295093.1 hypothetical protein [Mitsuaria sp. BK041]MBB3364309.1 hypothetical protein [Mitsuaria sp. BK045]
MIPTPKLTKSPRQQAIQERTKDSFFDGHRTARSTIAKQLVSEVLTLLSGLDSNGSEDGTITPRLRARRLVDQRLYEQQVEAVLCDLISIHRRLPGRGLCVTRNKRALSRRDRYQAPFVSEKLIDVVDALVAVGICTIRLGAHRRVSGGVGSTTTTIRPGPALLALLARLPVSLHDLGRHPGQEVIVLKAPKARRGESGERLDYEDTPERDALREEVRRINRWLADADIEYAPLDTHPRHAAVDAQDRALRRVFINGVFDQHGRLYGGFWENLRSQDRKDCILIDGEAVTALDYGQMGVRLMYAHAGVAPHFEDAYAIPGLEQHREGTKKLINAMLNVSKPLAKTPSDIRELLPVRIVVNGHDIGGGHIKSLTKLVTDFHHPVAHLFHQGMALRGMRQESDIMVRVLLDLINQGITALPIHDGLLVAESRAAAAEKAMLRAFEAVTGHAGVVKLD